MGGSSSKVSYSDNSGQINQSLYNIRNQIKSGQEDWKQLVDDKAHEILSNLLKSK